MGLLQTRNTFPVDIARPLKGACLFAEGTRTRAKADTIDLWAAVRVHAALAATIRCASIFPLLRESYKLCHRPCAIFEPLRSCALAEVLQYLKLPLQCEITVPFCSVLSRCLARVGLPSPQNPCSLPAFLRASAIKWCGMQGRGTIFGQRSCPWTVAVLLTCWVTSSHNLNLYEPGPLIPRLGKPGILPVLGRTPRPQAPLGIPSVLRGGFEVEGPEAFPGVQTSKEDEEHESECEKFGFGYDVVDPRVVRVPPTCV